MSDDQDVGHKGGRANAFYTLLPLITRFHASAQGTFSHRKDNPTESNDQTREIKVKILGNDNLTNTEL